ncbi:hypothetical protein CEP52_010839 [Fusarium oligoseptatum]|uniref:Enoyl reductase (ER) domain-containing protein n=1 Tax=Fusarium oligoseptatum TaxID=2604345 RepID=A0A428T6C9_9HYPO|nr:hypothetical protein CEP52_010839 [Fusarium oligoseptatum]
MSAPISFPSSPGRPPPLGQIGTISTDDYFQNLPTELRIAIMHRCHSAIDIKALILASPAMLACLEENRPRCLQGVVEKLKYQIQSESVLPLALLAGRLRHICEKYQGSSREVLRRKIQQVLKEEIDLEGWENNLIALCHLTPLFHNGKEFVSQTGPQVPSMPLSTPPDMQLHTSYFIISMMQGFEEYCGRWEREGLEAYFRFDGYCNAFFYGREPLFEESTAIEEQFFRLSGIGDNRTEALVTDSKTNADFVGSLQLRETEKPVPGENEVLVRLRAAALNHRDLFVRQHQYPAISLDHPMLSDGYGVITELGRGVSNNSLLGENVLLTPMRGWISDPAGPEDRSKWSITGSTRLCDVGTAQDYVCVHQDEVVPAPKHLSAIEGAALPLVGLTAWRALTTKAAIQPGQNVLITGIGGGVALSALQFSAAMGVNVFVTSGSQEKLDRARHLGAQGGTIYKVEEWEADIRQQLPSSRPFIDAVIDGAGGDIVGKAVVQIQDN